VDENVDATRAFYGVAHPSAQILKGEVATPPDARPFVRTVAKYFSEVSNPGVSK
jgi:SH3 domain-containing YSC84-like protein 1